MSRYLVSCFSRAKLKRRAGVVVALFCCCVAAPVAAQVTAQEPRGYSAQYLLVVLLLGMAVSAVCKPSYRHAKPED